MKVKDLKDELRKALAICEQQDETREVEIFAWADQDGYTIAYECKHVTLWQATATGDDFE